MGTTVLLKVIFLPGCEVAVSVPYVWHLCNRVHMCDDSTFFHSHPNWVSEKKLSHDGLSWLCVFFGLFVDW